MHSAVSLQIFGLCFNACTPARQRTLVICYGSFLTCRDAWRSGRRFTQPGACGGGCATGQPSPVCRCWSDVSKTWLYLAQCWACLRSNLKTLSLEPSPAQPSPVLQQTWTKPIRKGTTRSSPVLRRRECRDTSGSSVAGSVESVFLGHPVLRAQREVQPRRLRAHQAPSAGCEACSTPCMALLRKEP